jgi:hypothetical protein
VLEFGDSLDILLASVLNQVLCLKGI